MVDAVKTFATSSGDKLRARLEGWAKQIKAWFAGPWDVRRWGKLFAGAAALAAIAWALWHGGAWLRQRWRMRRKSDAFDPVRREAGVWLRRLSAGDVNDARAHEIFAVRAELERLRYGRRDTWPDPRAVFKRAKLARRELQRTTRAATR